MSDDDKRQNEIFGGQRAQGTVPSGLTFDVPTVDVPLPSRGLVYPETSALAKKDSVQINAMTAAQENILTNRSMAKKGNLLSQLLQSCMCDKGVVTREMLMGDRNAVMVALRISGYGSQYKCQVQCPVCEEHSTQTFDLTQLPIRRLEIEPNAPGTNLFDFQLPASRARVQFRFLTGADEEDIAVVQTQKKKAGAAPDGDLVTSGLMYSVVSVNGISDRSQLSVALPRMLAMDSQALRRHIQDNEPGIQLRASMSCPACGTDKEVDLPLGANFFWPGSE